MNLSTINTFQQFMLFSLILLGSAIFVSAFVVHVRKKAFERRFDYIAELRRRKAEQVKKGHHPSLVRRLSRSLTRFDARPIIPGTLIHEPKSSENSEQVRDDPSAKDATPSQSNDVTENRASTNEKEVQQPSSTSEQDSGVVEDDAKKEQAFQTDLAAGHDANQETQISNPPLSQSMTVTYRSDDGDEIQIARTPTVREGSGPPDHIAFGPDTFFHRPRIEPSPARHNHHRFISLQGVGAHPHATIRRRQETGLSLAPSENPSERALADSSARTSRLYRPRHHLS